jgi:hypothetical protein
MPASPLHQPQRTSAIRSDSSCSHSLSFFPLPYSLTGEARRNGGQEARAVVHKGCCFWLLRHSSCGLRVPGLRVPSRRTRNSPPSRQVSPRTPVAGNASVSPCRCCYSICFKGSAAWLCGDAGELGKEMLGGVRATGSGSIRDNRWCCGRAGIRNMDEEPS